MSRADLVVNGRVTIVTTCLNADQSDVITEYTIAPIQAFKQRDLTHFAHPGWFRRLSHNILGAV